MGLYWDTYAFYGCRVAESPDALVDKLENLTKGRPSTRSTTPIRMKQNYIITRNGCFLIVPRTKKKIDYQPGPHDLDAGYLKLTALQHLVTPADITPTAEEHATISRFADALMSDDEQRAEFGKLQPIVACIMLLTLDFSTSIEWATPLVLDE